MCALQLTSGITCHQYYQSYSMRRRGRNLYWLGKKIAV
uniref:Uncharacterized protein n=1 Tax=Arundo donax TaxID=35708 RepID=A0A0A9D2P9_ARUDO